MKSIINSLLFLSVIGLLIYSCETDNEKEKQSEISGQIINSSECKHNLKTTILATETPDSISCVEYNYDIADRKLSLKHINAGFNCCAESMYCEIELIGDTILVSEFEESALCDCDCLYDLDIEINGVKKESYILKFIEPYSGDQDEILFEIDFSQSISGSFCVTRKHYPWGS